jgi:hypothetical protein
MYRCPRAICLLISYLSSLSLSLSLSLYHSPMLSIPQSSMQIRYKRPTTQTKPSTLNKSVPSIKYITFTPNNKLNSIYRLHPNVLPQAYFETVLEFVRSMDQLLRTIGLVCFKHTVSSWESNHCSP